jgi:sec-independent protein translocase protein TatA
MRPEPIHILILVIVILLIFGAPKLPMIAKNIGKSLKFFKTEVDELRGEKGGDSGTVQRDEAPRQLDEASSAPTVDDVTGSSPSEEAQPQTDRPTDDDSTPRA